MKAKDLYINFLYSVRRKADQLIMATQQTNANGDTLLQKAQETQNRYVAEKAASAAALQAAQSVDDDTHIDAVLQQVSDILDTIAPAAAPDVAAVPVATSEAEAPAPVAEQQAS